jgi:hypothetical protein
LDRSVWFGLRAGTRRSLISEYHEHRAILRQIECHTRAAVRRTLARDVRVDAAADRIPQFGLPVADSEHAFALACTGDEVDVGLAVAPVRVLERPFEVGRQMVLSQDRCQRGRVLPQLLALLQRFIAALCESRRALRLARPEHDWHARLLEFCDFAQRRQRHLRFDQIHDQHAVGHAVGQHDRAVPGRRALKQASVVITS